MNYLELCQRTRMECAISGAGPAAVTNQTGVYAKIVKWVNDAWRELQSDKKHWRFMWSEFSFDTIVNTADTTTTDLPVQDFRRDHLVIYDKSKGLDDQSRLVYLKFDDWQARFAARNVPAARPQYWTVLPSGALRLTPAPDAVYTVKGTGQLKIQTLKDNTDVPILPEQYHLAIVWMACAKWFADQEATQRSYDVAMNLATIKDELLRDQLPEIDWGFKALA